MKQEEMLLESIYNTVECGIMRFLRQKDNTYKVLSMNQAALQMLDYNSIQECMEDGFAGVASHVVDSDKIKILSMSKKLQKPGDLVKFEYQVKGKEGNIRWIFACSQYLMEDEHGEPMIQRTMIDITDKKLLELQLQEEREIYQLAIESSTDVLYIYNLKADKLVLYTPGERESSEHKSQRKMIENFSSHMEEYLTLDDMEKLKGIINSKSSSATEIQVKTNDKLHWYLVSGKPVFEEERMVRVVGTLHDIHEMKMAINEGRNSIEELKMNQLAVNSLSEAYTGIHFVNLLTDEYQAIRVPKHLSGFVPKKGNYTKVITSYIESQVALEEQEKVKKFLKIEYLQNQLGEDVTHIEIEYCGSRTEKGKSVWLRTEVKLVSCKDGVPEYVTITFIDITGEKREALRRQYDNALLGYAISDSYDAIYEIGLEHDTLYRVVFDGKQIFREKFEKKYSELIFENVEGVIHPDFQEEYCHIMELRRLKQQILEKQPEAYYELLVKTSKNKWEWMAFTFRSIIRDNSQRMMMFVKSVDARKRKELESLEREKKSREAIMEAYEAANQANEAKSEFLSRMSHDIRTPMNAIIGMTAIAATHIDNPERVKDCLNKISSSSKLLLTLINEVLDMSKVESGNISLNEEEFNLSDLIQNMIEVAKPDLFAKSHEFKVSIGMIKHEEVIGDVLRIQQVFMNLISNAIKYTPETGAINLYIEEKPSGMNHVGCYEFIFEDNGIGMSEEFIPKLFEPFERAEDSRVSKVQGTGLGMAITQSIVRTMNGSIKVESELDKGTRISVTLFLKLQDKEMDVPQELADLPILVVDDDADVCESTCMLLKDIGMRGESVLSGAQAIKKVEAAHYRKEDYFAVIMDWKMPEMDGIQTTRAIRALVGPEIPIIVLSAYDWSEIEEEAKEAGVNGFITKPLFKSKLVYTLQKFVTGKEEKDAEKMGDLSALDFSGKNILLVEDNELNQEIAMEIIGMTGASIITANDGREAVEFFEKSPEHSVDLIFMDIQMPVMNGYDASSSIRKLERADAKTVPIIAMTANAFAEDIQMAKDSGMNGHLAKPLDINQLISVLEEWLL